MNGRALTAEMNAAFSRICDRHYRHLEGLGSSLGDLATIGQFQTPIGVARLEMAPDGLFTPSEAGLLAYVQPVAEWDSDYGVSDIVDLVAWRPSEPSRWWWRCGTAFALGDGLLDGDEPVPVVGTPLAWLAAGGKALCILDWSILSPIWTDMRSAPPLIFSDDRLRHRVRNHLIRSAPMPSLELHHAA